MLVNMLILTLLFLSASDAIRTERHFDSTDLASQESVSHDVLQNDHSREKRNVGLAENENSITYQPCLLPDGKAGRCKPIKNCMQDDFKSDVTKLLEYICVIKSSSVGVCCPDELVTSQRGGVIALAGNLPATAPLEEPKDAALKNTRAENRGCGVSTRPQSTTTGSRRANPREWPWMVAVTPKGLRHHCGGVLITDRHVLTAAHCVKDYSAEQLSVRLGDYDLVRTNETRAFDFSVVEKRQHEEFDDSIRHNDIAILKLERAALFNSYVWPVCLPPLGIDYVNKTAFMIGWGTIFFGGPLSNVLMEVSIPIWELNRCKKSFVDAIFEENICAAAYEGGKDACQNDSGGPLMYQLPSGRWIVVGVVSWGVRCGEANHPGVYTRIDSYLPWIVQNVQF